MLAGLAYEKSVISTPCLTPPSTALAACFKLLGPSVLRLGGNSTDTTTWVPNGNGGTAGQVTESDIDQLAVFVRTTGWRIIYGINLATNTPAAAAAEAAYAATAFGGSLLALEIGNEPDCYAQKGLRQNNYTFSQFVTEWSALASAISRRVPNAPLSGPVTSDNVKTWTEPFAHEEATRIKLLTQHYYIGAGKNPTPTIGEMLNDTTDLSRTLAALRSSVAANSISGSFRLAEANSFYDGGAPGVSDSFASALWTVDFLLQCASFGAAGANLQGGCDGKYAPCYTPIADYRGAVTSIRPIYYGMLLVSRIAPGLMHPVLINSDLPMSAYAISAHDGSTSMVIINKDPHKTVTATVAINQAASQVTGLSLTAPTLDSLTGTTLGGAIVNPSGAWAPQKQIELRFSGGQFQIDASPASAMLLRIT